MTSVALAALLLQVPPGRFQPVAPLPGLPWINVDTRYCQGGFADDACRKTGAQGRVLWIDGTANLDKLGSDGAIRTLMEKVHNVGFNTVVLDVKPIVGRTLYPSRLTDQMTSWRGKSIPAGYDPVRAVERECRRLGVSFLVSLNAYSEGHSYSKRDEAKADTQFGAPGWGYQRPELQSVIYVQKPGPPMFRRSGEDQSQIPLMMNPHHPQVQSRILEFVREVVTLYKPDGVLFDDRFRFHGLDADFSDLSRRLFERRVRASLRWPQDIYEVTDAGGGKTGLKPGPYFDAWLAWRAEELARFVSQVRSDLSELKPGTLFGIYAGSWYGDYAKYGNNYASSALSAGFPFLTRAYRQAGLAAQLDVLITGCYYTTATMHDAMVSALPAGRTVEAAGDVSNRVARDQTWVYAGIQLVDFKGDTAKFARALQAAVATTQGVMVFDLSHDIDPYWPLFAAAFKMPTKPPHAIAGLLDTVRKKRKDLDDSGARDRAFPMFEGAPGTGF